MILFLSNQQPPLRRHIIKDGIKYLEVLEQDELTLKDYAAIALTICFIFIFLYGIHLLACYVSFIAIGCGPDSSYCYRNYREHFYVASWLAFIIFTSLCIMIKSK